MELLKPLEKNPLFLIFNFVCRIQKKSVLTFQPWEKPTMFYSDFQ